MVVAGGTAVAAGLAGCLGDDDDDDDDTVDPGDDDDDDTVDPGDDDDDDDEPDPTDPVTDTMVAEGPGHIPTDTQWNMLNSSNQPSHNMRGPLWGDAAYIDMDGELHFEMLEGWDLPDSPSEGDTVELYIRDDFTFHDGTEVTVDHWLDAFEIRMYVLNQLDQLRDPEIVDDSTIALTLDRAYNIELLRELLAWQGPQPFGGEAYDPLIEEIRDSDYDEDVIEDLSGEWGTMTFDEPNGTGPFQFVEASETTVLYEQYDDWPLGDFNFDYIEFEHTETMLQAISADVFDVTRPHADLLNPDNLPGDHVEVRTQPGGEAWGLGFNMIHDLYSNRNVRKAIAHIVSRFDVALDSAPSGVSSDERFEFAEDNTLVASGTLLTNPQAEEWLDDVIDDWPMYNYGATTDNQEESHERATELLEEEGFTLEDDVWYKPDGDRWEPEIWSPTWEEPVARSFHGQFQAFGIDSTVRVQEDGVFWDTIPDDGAREEQEWGMCMINWVKGDSDHPFHIYDQTPMGWTGFLAGMHQAFEDDDGDFIIPTPPIGEPDGSLEDVNATELLNELGGTADPDRERELVQELAWMCNDLMMIAMHHVPPEAMLLNHDTFDWPEEGSAFGRPSSLWDLEAPLRLGEVQAREE